jgi:hypothetical protein
MEEVARRSKTLSTDINKRKMDSGSVATVLLEDLTINSADEFLMQYDAEFVLLIQT